MAFPATQASVNPEWINQTGCDSLFTAAADSSAAYFGGHERFSMNPNACDTSVPAGTTRPAWRAQPGYRDAVRQLGGFRGVQPGPRLGDVLVTGAGLWIASDNLRWQQPAAEAA
jgi:hypothetical protein